MIVIITISVPPDVTFRVETTLDEVFDDNPKVRKYRTNWTERLAQGETIEIGPTAFLSITRKDPGLMICPRCYGDDLAFCAPARFLQVGPEEWTLDAADAPYVGPPKSSDSIQCAQCGHTWCS